MLPLCLGGEKAKKTYHRGTEVFFLFFFRTVFLYDEVVYDEVLALGRVLTHIVFQEFGHLVVLVERHQLQTDVRTDETGKFVG